MQTIILTGATGGLGSNLSKKILEKNIGRLVCVYRNENKFHGIFNELRKDVLAYQTYEKDDYKKLITKIENRDISEIVLVLNAFSIIPIKRIGEFSFKEIEQMIDGNITQNIILLNRITSFCKEHCYKLRIINLDSGAADFPLTGWGNYCASKAYINAFLTVVSLENPEYKVVSFDPGVMDTTMQEQIRMTDKLIFDKVEQFISYKTEGKLTTPEIIACELIERYILNWKAETFREKYK